jgi:hypothetical protein
MKAERYYTLKILTAQDKKTLLYLCKRIKVRSKTNESDGKKV